MVPYTASAQRPGYLRRLSFFFFLVFLAARSFSIAATFSLVLASTSFHSEGEKALLRGDPSCGFFFAIFSTFLAGVARVDGHLFRNQASSGFDSHRRLRHPSLLSSVVPVPSKLRALFQFSEGQCLYLTDSLPREAEEHTHLFERDSPVLGYVEHAGLFHFSDVDVVPSTIGRFNEKMVFASNEWAWPLFIDPAREAVRARGRVLILTRVV
jgi:hypothetical protein